MNKEKPIVKITGDDSNVFFVLGKCTKALRREGQTEQAEKLTQEVFKSHSFEEAIAIMSQYCELE